MAFALRRTLTQRDVGRRVMVRSRRADGAAQDVLGTLERFDDDGLAVRRRDGTLVDVASADLLAGHVVPPPPGRPRQHRNTGTAATAAAPVTPEDAGADGPR